MLLLTPRDVFDLMKKDCASGDHPGESPIDRNKRLIGYILEDERAAASKKK